MPLSLSFVRIPTHVYRRNSNLNPSPYPINGWLSLLVLVDVLHPVKGISMSELSSSKNPDSFSQGGSKNSLVKIRSRDQASWFDWFELSKRIYAREGRENYEQFHDPVAIQPGLQKLREKYIYTCTHVAATASWMTQNTWIILSRRLYFEMRHVSFSTIRSVRGPRNSRNLGPIFLAREKSLFTPSCDRSF